MEWSSGEGIRCCCQLPSSPLWLKHSTNGPAQHVPGALSASSNCTKLISKSNPALPNALQMQLPWAQSLFEIAQLTVSFACALSGGAAPVWLANSSLNPAPWNPSLEGTWMLIQFHPPCTGAGCSGGNEVLGLAGPKSVQGWRGAGLAPREPTWIFPLSHREIFQWSFPAECKSVQNYRSVGACD